MVKFFTEGDKIRIVNINDDIALDKLTPRVYTLGIDPLGQYFLSIVKDQLSVPSKVYGKTEQRADKVIKSYSDRASSTGILLTGDKGSGKTMLTSLIADKMINAGYPVILINDNYAGDGFVNFINLIGECVIVFDEFGKVYQDKENEQDGLLTLLDGVGSLKRLLIFTENNRKLINEFMIDRPGRVYYHFKYGKLDELSTKEYCLDKGIDEKIVGDILDVSRLMDVFSFDILQAIVEEYKRFGESIKDIVEDLNVDFDKNSKIRLEVKQIVHKGTNAPVEFKLSSAFLTKPISNDHAYIYLKTNKASNGVMPELVCDDEDDEYIHFYDKHLKFTQDETLIYDNGDYIITCEVLNTSSINYGAYKAF